MWMSNHTFHAEVGLHHVTPQVMAVYHHGPTNFTLQLPCTQIMEVITVLSLEIVMKIVI